MSKYDWRPGLPCLHGRYWSCVECGTRGLHAPRVPGAIIDCEFEQPETLPAIKAAEPALELIEANEPSDTERPPPPADLRACYWCGQPAVDIVHGDIPTCDSCKRRAVGKRARRDQ